MQNLAIGFVAGLGLGVIAMGLLIYWVQDAAGPKF